MKNLIFVLTIFCLFTTLTLEAQTPMTKGANIIMAGIGIGGYSGGSSSSVSPTFSATYQRGLLENLGPGNLSIGGTVAFKTGKFDGFTTDVRWNYFATAARASYHPHFVKSEKFDLFGGFGLGYYSASSKVSTTDHASVNASASAVAITFHVGARYAINKKLGAWVELGTEMSLLSGGLAYKF